MAIGSDAQIQRVIATHATAPSPGAIAIIQLTGDCQETLKHLTGIEDWPIGAARLTRLVEIDDALICRINDRCAQIMPHGGPRVVQRLFDRLTDCGAEIAAPTDTSHSASQLFPEAEDDVEALALAAAARAPSSMAIDLLLVQPAIWRRDARLTSDDLERSQRLNRLLNPPLVVLAGSPNVGKSTLSNALLGRGMSIAMDRPGTTRDYTAAQIDLAGLTVQWHDTPGIRSTDDPLEDRAIELARRLIGRADLLLAMTDAEHDWPELDRPADLRIASKADLSSRADANIAISTQSGEGIAQLVRLIRDTLVPEEDVKAARQRPWLFDRRLLKRMPNAAGEDVPGVLP